MSYFLIGYDVEMADIENNPAVQERELIDGPKFIQQFINSIVNIHEELEAPCTLYITGNTIRKYKKHFEKLIDNSMFDIESHTFEHLIFKTVMDKTLDGKTVMFEGSSLTELAVSVAKNKILIEEFFGSECEGICTPWGYFKGLSDRPDLLDMLYNQGVRFIRSYGRNSNDQSPVQLDIQPYWYDIQGYPDLLEIPFHGWIDCHYRRIVGYEDWDSYVRETKKWIDLAAQQNVDLSICQHDWSSVLYDSEMKRTAEILEYAKKKGLKPITSREYYFKKLSERKTI